MTAADIITICSNTDRYNFHGHTQYCDGHADMEDFVTAAIAGGTLHYGFTPHSPIPFPSPCNMSREAVTDYMSEIGRLREKYGDHISLYAGMEVDYLDGSWGPACDYIQSLPLDFRIGSVHFIPADNGFVDVDGRFDSFKVKMEKYFSNDIEAVVKLFYSQSIRMVEAGGFDIIGHFDKIGHNASHFRPGIESEEWYKSEANRLVDCIIDNGCIVELNTKAYHQHNHRLFPSERLLRRVISGGAKVIVNSDAHDPRLIEAGRPEAFELLRMLYAS